MSYLKHNAKDAKGAKKRTRQKEASGQHVTANMDTDGGLEAALDGVASAIRSYAQNAAIGENSLALFTGSGEAYCPVRVSLEGDAVERIATAFERIADAISKTEVHQQAKNSDA